MNTLSTSSSDNGDAQGSLSTLYATKKIVPQQSHSCTLYKGTVRVDSIQSLICTNSSMDTKKTIASQSNMTVSSFLKKPNCYSVSFNFNLNQQYACRPTKFYKQGKSFLLTTVHYAKFLGISISKIIFTVLSIWH